MGGGRGPAWRGPNQWAVGTAVAAALVLLVSLARGGGAQHHAPGGGLAHGAAGYGAPAVARALDFSVPGRRRATASEERVLVVYAYEHSDDAASNLRFFARNGFDATAALGGRGVPVEYVVILSGESGDVSDEEVARAAAAARAPVSIVRRRGGPGRDGAWCALAELLSGSLAGVRLKRPYSHFVLLSGAARGPFLPTWHRGSWVDALLSQLDDDVKLVGPSLHCGGGERDNWTGLHLQGPPLATDAVGMAVLLDRALSCGGGGAAAAAAAEVAATQEMLKAGHSLRALQYVWGGFPVHHRDLGRDEVTRRCNAVTPSGSRGADPSVEGAYASECDEFVCGGGAAVGGRMVRANGGEWRLGDDRVCSRPCTPRARPGSNLPTRAPALPPSHPHPSVHPQAAPWTRGRCSLCARQLCRRRRRAAARLPAAKLPVVAPRCASWSAARTLQTRSGSRRRQQRHQEQQHQRHSSATTPHSEWGYTTVHTTTTLSIRACFTVPLILLRTCPLRAHTDTCATRARLLARCTRARRADCAPRSQRRQPAPHPSPQARGHAHPP
jgi:hypothetical protein